MQSISLEVAFGLIINSICGCLDFDDVADLKHGSNSVSVSDDQ